MEKTNTSAKASVRPPVVVILGHVDHGKTTLLDYIRSTKVADREAGGITQGIGASVITTTEGKKITFIDTPGHAAFSGMRSQGARVADIAVLVVGANDGVKPQTREALEHILSANIPFVVAVTKMDLPSASSIQVKTELQKEGVLFEGLGGEVPLVEVSAKTGKGVDNLLEMISLLSEMKGVFGDPTHELESVIIEVGQDKRGATASVIVRNGHLRVSDFIVSQDQETKVRALFDSSGKSVTEIGPGLPCLVLGFTSPPMLGSRVWHKGDNAELQKKSANREITGIYEDSKLLTVIIKAKNSGSLDAILENLNKKVFVVSSGVGGVTESDVFLAKTNGARIFAFEIPISGSVKKLAEMERIKVESFDIIYQLFEKVDEILKGGEIQILGKAQIVAIFPYENKKVAGSKITFGRIAVGDSVSLSRGEAEIGKVKILSIKKLREEVTSVKQGEECGILFVPQFDFETGDVLTSLGK